MILGWVIEQVNTKCCLSVYLDPFGKNDGYSWFHALLENLIFSEFPCFLLFIKVVFDEFECSSPAT